MEERDDPKPSDYPGTGTAYVNEWKYLGFDMETDADKANVEIIHNAFDGMRRHALAALSAAIGNDDVYDRFFPEDDEDDIIREPHIIAALRQIIPEKDKDGNENTNADCGEALQKMIIDNKDFNKDSSNAKDPRCSTDGILAYTNADNGHTHFCDAGLRIQDTTKLTCDSDLDDFVSEKMDSTGRVALHEVMHVDSIFDGVYAHAPLEFVAVQDMLTSYRLDFSIVDGKNKDKEGAFGPERAFALVHGTPAPIPGDPEPEEGSGENAGLAEVNADNYAWMAAVS